MCDVLMIYFGWQTLSERIRNHKVCAYVFNRYLKTLKSFFHNQELDVNVFGLRRRQRLKRTKMSAYSGPQRALK